MAPPPPPTTPNLLTIAPLIPLTQTTSHTYTLDLSDTFCIGTVPNGGYITSCFLHCARTHMSLTNPTRHCPDPINLHLEFLRRTSSGPATFTIRDLKLGSRISNLHISLSQHRNAHDSSTPTQVEVEGYITLTDLNRETGLSQNTNYTLHPPALPVTLPNLTTNTDKNYILRRKDPYGSFLRAVLNCEMYLVRPSRRPTNSSPAIADQWVRFTPLAPSTHTESLSNALKNNTLIRYPGRWTNDALGFLVDIFPQLNERYLNAEIEDAVLTPESEISDEEIRDLVRGKKKQSTATTTTKTDTKMSGESESAKTFWYPTLLLNLDVKKNLPKEGVEWLFVRVQAKTIQRGRFDLNVEVWDTEGDIVALSTHAALIMDASRNVTRKEGGGGSGSGKGKKKESKI